MPSRRSISMPAKKPSLTFCRDRPRRRPFATSMARWRCSIAWLRTRTLRRSSIFGHESFEAFFAVTHQIGFVEEARSRSIAVAILFTMTPDKTSVEAYRSLRGRFAHATLAPVHNEMLGPAQHRDKYPLASGSPMVRVPALAPGLRRHIETPPFSFAGPQMADAVGIPPSAHVELQRWLRRIYLEFRELDLRILLADLRSSIRFGS